ncbi:laminin subunit beta-3 [Protopterus annectens]|uniref:laminin subunit beta-3 n=1 Tax=Protopterus annectens TaxID=7888 RepID=UPI001CF94851|nr:laminin subunit beta-3 [Protopterus annectens]
MLILLLLFALPSLSLAQQDCSRGACYPAFGDILIGRASSLQASSTCGLTKSEVFCTPHGEYQLRCCRCDSRNPQNSNGHRIENVLQSAGLQKWWQSKNDVDEVSVQLDLAKKFQLNDVTLDFKSLSPAAVIFERSSDFGRTWEIYQYFADDCSKTFPWVRTGRPETVRDVRCQQLPSSPGVPPNGKIVFNPVSQAPGDRTPYSQKTNSLGFTNLRVKFIKLARPPSRAFRIPDAFYALKEMRVTGSCLCFGHANHCVSSTAVSQDQISQVQVYDTCVCQHKTAGPNCERCAEFYNDLPWKPAEENNPNTCKSCNCNNHAERCHFDPAVFQASGGISGGVCDACRDNTFGKNCETCKQFYYRNPERDITHREACIPCECDPDGSLDGGKCNPSTGQCICKEHVEGERCDRCKTEFYGLSASNPQGCRRCGCNYLGSHSNQPCDKETGQCFCYPNVFGQNCDQCATGYWNLASGRGCQKCNCNPFNSFNTQCNQLTGQCFCKPGFGGQTCTGSGCPERTFGDLTTGCRSCDCEFSGTEGPGCDKNTGKCLCRPGATGIRCDQCKRGYCSQYYGCVECHQCFQFYDNELTGFAVRHTTLRNSSLYIEGTKEHDFGPQFSLMEYNLRQIQDLVTNPLVPDSEVTTVRNIYRQIRENYQRISPTLPVTDVTASLSGEIDSITSDLQRLTIRYEAQKQKVDSMSTTNPTAAFATIESAYQTSSDAKRHVNEATQLVYESSEQRQNAQNLLDGPDGDKEKLDGLQNQMNYPDLNLAIRKVCGGFSSEPCTPEQCSTSVCPPGSNGTCYSSAVCTGALPVTRFAREDATKANTNLQELDKQIQEAEKMITQMGSTLQELKNNAQQRIAKTTTTRNQIQEDAGDVRNLIQQIKTFLSDPDIDPTKIEEVSDYVLSLHLPTDSTAIMEKLEEIRTFAAKLPNVDLVLKETADSVAKAKQLKKDAELARDKAVAVDDSVEAVGDNLRQARAALSDASDTISRLNSSLQMLSGQFTGFEQELLPSTSSLSDLRIRLQKLNSGISQLEMTTNQNWAQAGLAAQYAAAASGLAGDAQQGFGNMQLKFNELKSRLGQGFVPGGNMEQRFSSLKTETEFLFQETSGMMQRIEEIKAGIERSNAAILLKSSRLHGLEEYVTQIRNFIHERVEIYSSCFH